MPLSIDKELKALCQIIEREYSASDISDALLTLKVPAAGYLPDIQPIPRPERDNTRSSRRLVAPVSTVLFVRKVGDEGSTITKDTASTTVFNIPQGKNWTDMIAASNVALVQQPQDGPEIRAALMGDIMTTRLKVRGVRGAIVNGRIRDVESCSLRCVINDDDDDENNSSIFHLWSRGFSASSPTLEALPSAVDVPLHFDAMVVQPGDILYADEKDRAVVVIPRELLEKVVDLAAVQKRASEAVLEKVKNGQSIPDAVRQHPDFYSAYSHR
ncbi:uncharacterized protein Z520_11270 [Fonsecaea multimorphosa CBS 102226]|uniref:Uncharacterized protein n=1 Tax=Fonsecaea multimorphosa CBS 102226 TaxID=1442371 RepID=A0A0D2JIL0_9EURO|nr:uncharacterized protein Z520_11270 [Fonsecaea multimorphosa CBS 102226]KIX92997.1 hypothetical protein Z520_11270 [Fonsecaea multimorphosa CBS 102226]OAL18245.1 hypothetical protein AYO22_10823 [Fonsecaea multimorphosa]